MNQLLLWYCYKWVVPTLTLWLQKLLIWRHLLDVQSKGLDFIKKWKYWNLNIFAFLCIFGDFLNFWCFVCGKFIKPCCHDRTAQLVVQHSIASIINQKTHKFYNYYQKKKHNFYKMATRSHHCPSASTPSLGYWYTGISGIQARAIPPPSRGSAPPVTTGNKWSFQWACPRSTLQKRFLFSLFMISFWEYSKKGVIFDKLYPFDCGSLFIWHHLPNALGRWM